MDSGTYYVRIGPFFYIGSSTKLYNRESDHRCRLTRGIHPNPRLQEAFDDGFDYSFQVHQHIPREKDETVKEFRDRLRAKEQLLIDVAANDEKLCNRSKDSRGPGNSNILKDKWKDPAFREKMLANRVYLPASEETRAKMSEAKRGARNVKARGVHITNPDGSISKFECASDAAKHLNVSQQLFHLWMSTNWPSENSRICNRWAAAYKAVYIEKP